MRVRCGIALVVALVVLAGTPRAAAQEAGEFFSPYLAEKNVEVGTFYLKKKNYDAAIERFLDAIRYQSNHARAHRLLAEALEKKGEKADAIAYYEKYLVILPSADDAGKVRKRIHRLRRELAAAAARRRKPSS